MEFEGVTHEQYILLTNEAGLAAMALSEGLTSLRKADFIKKPYATHAFFSLSIGLERLMKLILIADYRQTNNDAFPDNGYLKKQGHNISDLYSACKQIADKQNASALYMGIDSDATCNEILSFLNDFARTARYYNLDMLTGVIQKNDEPLKRWDEKINQRIIALHYRRPRDADIMDEVAMAYKSNIMVLHHDYSGSEINSLPQLVANAHTKEVSRKYSMLYTYRIIRFLSKLLHHMESKPPFLNEYFEHFRYEDKSIVTKKVWSLYNK